MKDKKISGFILAGGKNSRMGSDKGLLVVKGKRIIEHLIEELEQVVDDIIIISNEENYNYLGYRVYRDILKNRGPMGGIHTALTFSKTRKNLIVGCDMPFLNRSIFQFIVDNSFGFDIAVPINNEKFEPLCAVYNSSCVERFSEHLKKNKLKIQDVLKEFQTNSININNTKFDSRYFTNINTPEELSQINSL